MKLSYKAARWEGYSATEDILLSLKRDLFIQQIFIYQTPPTYQTLC